MPKNRPCVVSQAGASRRTGKPIRIISSCIAQARSFAATTAAVGSRACGPLGDRDAKDRAENLCVDVVGTLPRCMDLITSEDVMRAIEVYFEGGAIAYLSAADLEAVRKNRPMAA